MEETVGVGPAHVVFMVLFLSTFAFLVIWVIGIAVRLRFPEHVQPPGVMPAMIRRRMLEHGRVVSVGLQDIRDDERLRSEQRLVDYEYAGLPRQRLPEAWVADVAERRN
jgi:hypothetical protein